MMKLLRYELRLASIASLVLVLLLAGCGNSNLPADSGKMNVVTSFYPLFDFATKIGGDYVHVVNLVPAGVEPHEWSPKIKDMTNISKADIFVYNGAGFEGWTDAYLGSQNKNSKLLAVEASAGADLIETDGEGFDPHIWLSPVQAKVIAANIRDAILQADPDHADYYSSNYNALIDKLDDLDRKLVQIKDRAPKNEIIVSHEAFGYIARDYGIRQIAIMGISPESEPTVQHMKEIKQFAEQYEIQFILFEELVSSKLADTLAGSLGIGTLVLNPIEGLTDKQSKAGDDYFSLMHANLTTIEQALQ